MHRTILASSAALLCVGYANAQPIPITNFSFEDPVFGPGGFNGNGPVPGWAAVANIGQSWGVFYPTVATWGYITSLGHQLLYTNGPTIEHVTSAQSQASTTYTLQVDVVNRPNFGANSYFIELYAGATLIARDDNSLHPPAGGYLVSTLTHSFPSSGPLIGQTLRIRLGGLNQTNFDNVRLSSARQRATPTVTAAPHLPCSTSMTLSASTTASPRATRTPTAMGARPPPFSTSTTLSASITALPRDVPDGRVLSVTSVCAVLLRKPRHSSDQPFTRASRRGRNTGYGHTTAHRSFP